MEFRSLFNIYCVRLVSVLLVLGCAHNATAAQIGGKAVKADLVAIFSGLEKIAESRSFHTDLAKLVQKHTAKLNLNKEQFKDLKEFLSIFSNLMKIDREQLRGEQHEYLTRENELYERQINGEMSQEELELLLPSLKKGKLMMYRDELWQQFNDKFSFSDLVDALHEVFGKKYDTRLMKIMYMLGIEAAQAGMITIDGKLISKKKK